MALLRADSLRNIWPFSMLENSELRESKELVQRLSVPESTKNFVFAIKVPEHDSTIYLLSAHSLSERSATDAECLIREIHPDAVVSQMDNSYFVEDSQVYDSLLESGSSVTIPTSVFKVLKQCFTDKFNREKYETVARILVLKEIFGIGLNGHLYAAKRVAQEIGSSFMVMDNPSVNIYARGNMQGRRANSLLSKESDSKRRFQISNDAQELMLKLLSSHITQLRKESDTHEVPPFARSIYAFLVDLHNIFSGLPSIRKALKMLSDVNRGESIDTEVLSELYLFQIAVEGLRIAFNNAGRIPIGILNRNKVQFSQLSSQDKAYALMADHLRSQAKKFKNIVAVVDASNLAGLRKHWNTCIPQQVKDMTMSESMLQGFGNEDNSNDESVTHICISASPFFKIVSFEVPTSWDLFLTQTHKAMTFGFTKVPGFASSGAKSTSLVNASLFTETIRAILIQNVIFSAEKTSFTTMRAALYQTMRKRRARPIGSSPLVTLGVSLATLAGLLVCEDRIECVAMCLPSAPSIAKLGRGIKNLHEASLEARRRDNNRVQNAIEVFRQRFKNFKLQR